MYAVLLIKRLNMKVAIHLLAAALSALALAVIGMMAVEMNWMRSHIETQQELAMLQTKLLQDTCVPLEATISAMRSLGWRFSKQDPGATALPVGTSASDYGTVLRVDSFEDSKRPRTEVQYYFDHRNCMAVSKK